MGWPLPSATAAGSRVDLAHVGELCRLVLLARRTGCRVAIESVPGELQELVALTGVGDVLSGGQYDVGRDDA